MHQGPQALPKKQQLFRQIFMERSEWSIHSGKWSRLDARGVFLSQPRMSPVILELYGNKEPRILLFVTRPSFTRLKHLNLRNNQICSIEAICKLNAPLLEQLLLGDNYITEIKSLRKLHCPSLRMLSLYANRIPHIDTLFQAHFPQLRVVILGLNCLALLHILNKCDWPSISKISFECNRRVAGRTNIGKWPQDSPILFG